MSWGPPSTSPPNGSGACRLPAGGRLCAGRLRFEALAGARPSGRRPRSDGDRPRGGPVPSFPTVPAFLRDLVTAMLAKDPAARPSALRGGPPPASCSTRTRPRTGRIRWDGNRRVPSILPRRTSGNNIPRVLAGRYEVGGLIGSGGMPRSTSATTPGSPVPSPSSCCARPRGGPDFHARFRREAQSAAGPQPPRDRRRVRHRRGDRGRRRGQAVHPALHRHGVRRGPHGAGVAGRTAPPCRSTRRSNRRRNPGALEYAHTRASSTGTSSPGT